MIRIGLILLGMSVLTACAQPEPLLIRDRPVVFIPDDQYFYCPVVAEFPDFETLTDEQIADLVIILDTYNRDCRDSMNALRVQLYAARAQLEQEQ